MTTVAAKTKIKKQEMDAIFSRLKKEYPVVLEQELKRIDALLALSKIKGTVQSNSITMNDIVNEVNIVRKQEKTFWLAPEPHCRYL